MQVKFSTKERTLVVSIIGELDHHSSEYIRQKIDTEVMKAVPKNIVFDFSKVTFMDSSGIGIIIGRYRNLEKIHGKMAIAQVSTQIRKIFEMSGLTKIIPVHEKVELAVNSMRGVE